MHQPPDPLQLHLQLPKPRRRTDAEITALLAALEQIPRDELPDGNDRDELAHLIRWGHVDNLYRPLGADYHNIAWSFRPAWMDPRQRVSDWIAACRAYELEDDDGR